MGIPESLEYFFLAVLLGVIVLIVLAIRASDSEGGSAHLLVVRSLLLCVLWLAVAGQMAHGGWLRDFSGAWPAFALLGLCAVGLVFALAFSPLGRRLLEGVGPALLVAFQAIRVPTEAFVHQLYQAGYAPVQVTYAGLNFDIFSGLTAPAMGWLVWRNKVGRVTLLSWNVFCLLLLFNSLSLTALSMPTPLRLFANEPTYIALTYPPFVWLPTFLLPVSLLGHLLVFRWIWWQRRGPTSV